MIVWNGPVGIIQSTPSASEDGTLRIATAIVAAHAFSVVGGGDTVEYIRRIGLGEKFSFISTGGGAMLTFLSGQELPGLTALLQ